MRVTWYGTATIGIDDGKNKLLFDPFVRRNKKLKYSTPIEGFAGADAVFITHGHYDHLFDVPQLTRIDRNVTVYCTKTPAETLMKNKVPRERISVIKPGDTVEIGDFKVTAYQSKHIKFDSGYVLSVFGRCALELPMTLNLFYHHLHMPEHHEIVMYKIENGGKSILLSGSFGTVDGVKYPEDCDMFILANGGNLSIPELTKPFIESIHPKRVFVDHFDDAFPPLTKRVCVEKFRDIMRQTHPEIEFIIPTERVPVEI
ncbi:MAG: MBL fold metallo-hydrolase [Oscillospiraceae bacterium]|nr:MBL fold metallo-hydrolase [Oscillospiraceae bacterium]